MHVDEVDEEQSVLAEDVAGRCEAGDVIDGVEPPATPLASVVHAE